MTLAIVLVALFCVLCVAGYFVAIWYDKFVRRNKQNRRDATRKHRRNK